MSLLAGRASQVPQRLWSLDVRAEARKAGHQVTALLWDLKEYYDHIDQQVLLDTAIAQDMPLAPVRLVIQSYTHKCTTRMDDLAYKRRSHGH